MRPLAYAVCLLAVPSALFADDFPVSSRVSAATVFPQGATLTRVAQLSVPAGRHQLILTDMPVIDPASLRLSAPGVTIGAIRYRQDFTPPRDNEETAAYEAAEAEVEAKERAVDAARDAVASILIEAEAARARIAFLEGIGKSDGLADMDPVDLIDIAAMIAEEGLTSRRTILEIETRAREAKRAVEDAEEDLTDAKQALAALDTEDRDRAYLAIDVQSDGGAQGAMTLSYTTDAAGWTPTYDVRLRTGDADSLSLENGAYVRQNTGDNWTDVALTLSTVRPTGQGEPGDVQPWLRRLIDPQRPEPIPLARAAKGAFAAEMDSAAPMAEQVVAESSFDGLSVTYSYPDPVSIANGADAVKIALGTLNFTPEVFARAVPIMDQTAYLEASFVNESGELILGGGTAQFYLNGTYVGQRYLDLIANGDDAELSFGPIEGLRLERVVKDRQEGDRGVITRSSEQNEEVLITLRNLTAREWTVRLRDRVPYSEQEDLQINYDATPLPTETDVDDRRGVLEWRFDMAPNSEQQVQLNHRLRWPDDMRLR
ncbi:DUF4139 domain-containing protein [Pseudooceanicola sp.]|uniref:DUF4139 domain-containing protein n=1 Tax=Pseudooceanicola sp. TaxID=1914328 RepID=UPI004059CB09